MIPLFPAFKNIEISDEKDIKAFVKNAMLPPYADFCFVNMWIWNTSGNLMLSHLNGNLVVIFSDYAKRTPLLSFFGKCEIEKTASRLLQFLKENCQPPQLKLVPKEIADVLANGGFCVEPDEDSHDYVYLVDNLAKMDRWRKSTKSKNIRRFIKKNPDYEVIHASIDDLPLEDLKTLFLKWSHNKGISNINALNEYKAFEKLLQLGHENIKIMLLYISHKLVGFTVYERIPGGDYALSRFAKADVSFDSSIYDILNWEEAKILQREKIVYYNWEQDLGILGLRYSKTKYRPAFLLKKFIVRF
jgi:uncharacterized protein